jgi:hypothetical protein
MSAQQYADKPGTVLLVTQGIRELTQSLRLRNVHQQRCDILWSIPAIFRLLLLVITTQVIRRKRQQQPEQPV